MMCLVDLMKGVIKLPRLFVLPSKEADTFTNKIVTRYISICKCEFPRGMEGGCCNRCGYAIPNQDEIEQYNL